MRVTVARQPMSPSSDSRPSRGPARAFVPIYNAVNVFQRVSPLSKGAASAVGSSAENVATGILIMLRPVSDCSRRGVPG